MLADCIGESGGGVSGGGGWRHGYGNGEGWWW